MIAIDLDAIDREISHIQQTGRPSFHYETEEMSKSLFRVVKVESPQSSSASGRTAKKNGR